MGDSCVAGGGGCGVAFVMAGLFWIKTQAKQPGQAAWQRKGRAREIAHTASRILPPRASGPREGKQKGHAALVAALGT